MFEVRRRSRPDSNSFDLLGLQMDEWQTVNTPSDF